MNGKIMDKLIYLFMLLQQINFIKADIAQFNDENVGDSFINLNFKNIIVSNWESNVDIPENSVLKSRVDLLSDIFRKNVEKLKSKHKKVGFMAKKVYSFIYL